MKRMVRAKIEWINKNSALPVQFPRGHIYSTPARFESQKDEWPNVAWSLVVIFENPFEEDLITIAQVAFLSPDAPQELLHPGIHFELLEGEKLVAKGDVL